MRHDLINWAVSELEKSFKECFETVMMESKPGQ